jgi:hypothetical protein
MLPSLTHCRTVPCPPSSVRTRPPPPPSLLSSHPPPRSYQDGGKEAEQLGDYAARKRLQALPSPLHFFSYLFAAGNLLAGPFFEASDYFDYIQRRASPTFGHGCDRVGSGEQGAPWGRQGRGHGKQRKESFLA